MLFFSGTIGRLLKDMDDKMLLTEQERVQHEIDYYANLLANPLAMEEFRAKSQHPQNHHHDVRELQQSAILRQNVTFIGCRFEENTYGIADAATNYGTLAAETADNDLVVRECIFSGNQFGDANIVVRTVCFNRQQKEFLSTYLVVQYVVVVNDTVKLTSFHSMLSTDIQGESYAIRIMPGTTFELTNSCFINNDFVGPGAVILSNPEDLLDHSGNFGTLDTGLECQFIAIGDTECIEYESPDVCVADPTLSISQAPPPTLATPMPIQGQAPSPPFATPTQVPDVVSTPLPSPAPSVDCSTEEMVFGSCFATESERNDCKSCLEVVSNNFISDDCSLFSIVLCPAIESTCPCAGCFAPSVQLMACQIVCSGSFECETALPTLLPLPVVTTEAPIPVQPPNIAPNVFVDPGTQVETKFTGLSIQFVGANEMSLQETVIFERVMTNWYEDFFRNRQPERILQSSAFSETLPVRDMTTSVSVTSQEPTANAVTVLYDQTIAYIAFEGALNAEDYIILPFGNSEAKNEYGLSLATQIQSFENIETPISRPVLSSSTAAAPATNADDGFPIGLVVGLAVAAVVASLIAGFVYKRYGRKTKATDQQSEPQPESPVSQQNNDPSTVVAVDNDPSTVVAVAVLDSGNDAQSSHGLPTFKDQVRSVSPAVQAKQNEVLPTARTRSPIDP